MTLVFIGESVFPACTAVSSDIANNTIVGRL